MMNLTDVGADDRNRTYTPLRELEPKSKSIATKGERGLLFQAFKRDPLAPISPSFYVSGHSTGTIASAPPTTLKDCYLDLYGNFVDDGMQVFRSNHKPGMPWSQLVQAYGLCFMFSLAELMAKDIEEDRERNAPRKTRKRPTPSPAGPGARCPE